MRLIKKMNQSRRDFDGEYECENCGKIEILKDCYDDSNFHDNVTPGWECKSCGKSSKDLKIKNRVETKYPEGFQV